MIDLHAMGGPRRVLLGLVLLAGLAGGAAFALVTLADGGSATSDGEPGMPSPTHPATATVQQAQTTAASPTPIKYAALLDGVGMSDEEWAARKDLLPVAVMVDNSPSAMPHSGLDKADLVIEAFVEGTITRFMAVYWRQDTDYVEPVRSARTPFVIWASELGALYAHAGGANTDNEANAVGQIAEWGIKDLTAFGSGADGAYYRDQSRNSPYNLVTGTRWLRDAAESMGFAGPPTFEPWTFKADREGTASRPAVAGIEVNFRDSRVPWQLVQWHWDEAANSYLRFQAGGPHVDAQSGEQLRFKNVIVMRVPWRVVDESAHVLLDQFGEGPATVFLDGKAIEGTWRKTDRTGRTRFFDASGQEIAFNRGPIFIEVVGPESLVTEAETVSGLPEIPPYEPPPHYVPDPAAEPEETDNPAPTPSASTGPSKTTAPAKTPAPTKTKVPTRVPTATPTSNPFSSPTAAR